MRVAITSLAFVFVISSLVAGTAYGVPPNITVSITVPNYDMEQGGGTNPQGEIGWYEIDSSVYPGGSGVWNYDDKLTGWDFYVNAYRFGGRWNPTDSNYVGCTDGDATPDPALMAGPQVAFFHWGAGTSSTTAYLNSHASLGTINAGWDFTLTMAVGSASGSNMGRATYIQANLLAGSNYNLDHAAPPANGVWADYGGTLTSATIETDGNVGQDLKIQFVARCGNLEKVHVDLDNIRLEATGPTLEGDANMDGLVDGVDFTYLKSNFGQTGKVWTDGDFNDDALVDGQDFTYLKGNFGKSVSPLGAPTTSGSPVPEPATVALLALGAAGIVGRRRRS